MKNSREYKVLEAHSGYEKGSVRKCHPNLAEILAKSGKISPDPIDTKKEKASPKKTEKEEKSEPDIISTDSKQDLPPEVQEAIEKTEKEEKGIVGKIKGKLTKPK